MLSGPPICALRASTRPIFAKGYSGSQKTWPTPTANDHKGSGPTVIRQDGVDRTFQRLDYAVEQGMATWPTPTANQFEGGCPQKLLARRERMAKAQGNNGFGMTLGMLATTWPTPRANENSQGPTNVQAMAEAGSSWLGQNRGATVSTVAQLHASTWQTPQANKNTKNSKNPQRMKENGVQTALADAAWITDKPAHGTTPNGSPEPTEKRGGLNPEFVCWLQAFPEEWLLCAPQKTGRRKKTSTVE